MAIRAEVASALLAAVHHYAGLTLRVDSVDSRPVTKYALTVILLLGNVIRK